MKIQRLETHDRLEHFVKDQSNNIAQGASDCLKINPLSLALQEKSPYIYIFAHPRTMDDGVTKKMLWQPRLGRPTPQTNSYLFRAQSKSDVVEICWLLPPQEMWPQYKKGNVTEHDTVLWSIAQYVGNKENLAKAHPQDFSKEKINEILRTIAREMEEKVQLDKLTRGNAAAFSSLSSTQGSHQE